MDGEVTKFEESILFFADAHKLLGPGSKFRDQSGASSQTLIDQTPVEVSPNGSGITTSYLTRGPSSLSVMSSNDSNCLSFGHRLLNLPNFSVRPGDIRIQEFTSCRGTIQDDNFARESDSDCVTKNTVQDLETWQFEVDHSVQILPGVKRIIDSIPAGRYAVATSRTKTYAYGCMSHVGIIPPPPVTITADDKRLKEGKPVPDPFLLAADCLRY